MADVGLRHAGLPVLKIANTYPGLQIISVGNDPLLSCFLGDSMV